MAANWDNRYQRDIIGRLDVLKLDRLSAWHALSVRCTECGHHGYITAAQLRRFYPRHVRIMAMQHRFKCTRCPKRGCVMWSVVKQRR